MSETAWDPWRGQVDREIETLRRDMEEMRRGIVQLQAVFLNMLPAVNEITEQLRALGGADV